MELVTRFWADERGADLVEYALLVALLSLAAFSAIGGVGASVKSIYQTLQAKIESAGSTP